MSNHYEDWTEWASDHPAQAAAESWNRSKAKALNISASGIDYTEPEECEHDNPDNDYECVDCGARIEGWEPTDSQIFAHYGQTKEVA